MEAVLAGLPGRPRGVGQGGGAGTRVPAAGAGDLDLTIVQKAGDGARLGPGVRFGRRAPAGQQNAGPLQRNQDGDGREDRDPRQEGADPAAEGHRLRLPRRAPPVRST